MAVGLGATGVFGVAACEPGDGLSAATVSYTTDQTATKELERRHVDVRWLSCTAHYGGANKVYTPGKSPSPTENTVASVDCQGQTGDGRDIVVKGKVTRAVDGACVRGDLRATVGGKQVFRVSGLGDCNATHGPTPPVTYNPRTDSPAPPSRSPSRRPCGARATPPAGPRRASDLPCCTRIK